MKRLFFLSVLFALLGAWGTLAQAEIYNLSVDGVTVNDSNQPDILGNGVFSYNPSTKTLTISGNYVAKNNKPVITSYIDGLTIYVAKDSKFSFSSGTSRTNSHIVAYEPFVLTGPGTLTLEGTYVSTTEEIIAPGYTKSGINLRSNGNIYKATIKNAKLNISKVVSGIYTVWNTSTTIGHSILIDNSYVNISTSPTSDNDRFYEPDVSSSVYASGTISCFDIQLRNSKYPNVKLSAYTNNQRDHYYFPVMKLLDSNGNELKEIAIHPSKGYGVVINGYEVTDDNKNDVLGNGLISFDGNKSIHLNGATAHYICNENLDGLIIQTDKESTTRLLIGTNGTTTTVTGEKLNVDASTCLGCPISLSKQANLIFKDTKVSILKKMSTTGTNDNTKRCILADEGSTLTFDYSEADIESASGMGYLNSSTKGSLVLNNCNVTLPKDAQTTNGWIYNSDGTTLPDKVHIAKATLYDLWVGSTQVSSVNQTDILGKGECSFDPDTKTLTFNKGILVSGTLVENKGVSGLTIWITKDLSLLGYGIISNKNLTLTGPGKLQIFSGNYNSIDMRDGATLTVNNIDLETNNGIIGNGSAKLVVESTATVKASTSTGAIRGFGGGIVLNSRAIQSPTGATVKDGTIVKSDGTVATEVTIGAPAVNLRVAGVGVTSSNQNDILGDGAASYDPTTNTLTLKGSINGNDKQGIWSNLADLTIQVAKNDLMVTSTGSAGIVVRGNTTIQGPGFLSVKSTSGSGILVSQGAKLTIENIVMDVSVSGRYNVGIKGFDYSSKEQLLIRNASVQVHSEQDDAIADFHGGITLKGCSIMEPEGGKIETSGSSGMPYRIVDATGRRAYTVKIGRSYNLWVGGIQVTDANRLDIRGDNGSSYDPVENKLVLTKTIDRETQEWGNVEYGIQNEIDGLTIYVKENITISSFAIAMVLRGSTTIAGGPLTVTTESDACIWHAADLALENVQLSAKGSTKNGIYGFSEGGRLIINNSAIYAEGETAAIKEDSKNIILENCRIVAPEGGRVQNGTVVDSDGNIAAEVTIGNPADVNRDGTVDSADIVAVIKEMPDGDKKADVNGDGVIDSADIVAVIKAMK